MKLIVKLDKEKAFIEDGKMIEETVLFDVKPEDFSKEERLEILRCKKDLGFKDEDVYILQGHESFNYDDYYAEKYSAAVKDSPWMSITEVTLENVKMILAERKKIIEKMKQARELAKELCEKKQKETIDNVLNESPENLSKINIYKKHQEYNYSYSYDVSFKNAEYDSKQINYRVDDFEQKKQEIQNFNKELSKTKIQEIIEEDKKKELEKEELETYLKSVVQEFGTENQKERYLEGFLPEKELEELIKKDILKDSPFKESIINENCIADTLKELSAEVYKKLKEIREHFNKKDFKVVIEPILVIIEYWDSEIRKEVTEIRLEINKHGYELIIDLEI